MAHAPAFAFEREGREKIPEPTERRIRSELKRIHGVTPSSWAVLKSRSGSYLQVAGGGMTCVLEYQDQESGSRQRAWQDHAVVPPDWADGTLLVFQAGAIPLNRDEWVRVEQVADAFAEFLHTGQLPQSLHWRVVTFRPNIAKPAGDPWRK
jgi:Immunity protein Imm1